MVGDREEPNIFGGGYKLGSDFVTSLLEVCEGDLLMLLDEAKGMINEYTNLWDLPLDILRLLHLLSLWPIVFERVV